MNISTYQSEQINEIMAALSKAQGKIQGAAKDCNNPFFKSKYADLASVWTACRDPLSENGLAVTQTVQMDNGCQVLRTVLGHQSGQWVSSIMPLPIKFDGKSNELQAMGAALTYMRRFALSAIVGVAPADDDDGNSYEKPKEKASQQVKFISEEQAKNAYELLKQCDKTIKDEVSDFMTARKIASFRTMPESLLSAVMQIINTHLSEKKIVEITG